MLNYLKHILGKKEKSFSVGDCWGDYPFKTFIEYNKILEDNEPFKNERIYALFTGLPLKDWLVPHKTELFNRLNQQLNFISEEPTSKIPTHIKRLKTAKYHKINKEFKEIKAGRYYNILNYINSLNEESSTTQKLTTMASCIAVCGLDLIYETEEYEEVYNEILETMPTDEAYSLGCFFFEQIRTIEQEHNENMVNKKPDDAYYQARFDDLGSKWGNFSNLHTLSKGNIIDSIKIMELSIGYVYAWEEYTSERNRCEDIYRDLKMTKK